jgi:demethylmenaquinone methyltransferase/2-methoxy-6-polyprenyl-1,4-benzoquinol methylase
MDKDPSVADRSSGDEQFRVGEMFGRIAPTYDLLNHVLSFGRDFAWRRKVAGRIGHNKGLRVADLATGTGDLLIALLRRHPDLLGAVGLDISEPMLSAFREKLRRAGFLDRVTLHYADAAATPFADGAFDVVTMGFGIRNTSDVGATLREIHRILKPGGATLILEFSLPRNPALRWCHLQYLRYGVPLIGAVISGDRQAYRYLNESIEAFYPPSEFCGLMRQAGFIQVLATPVTWGVASIYRGQKPCE